MGGAIIYESVVSTLASVSDDDNAIHKKKAKKEKESLSHESWVMSHEGNREAKQHQSVGWEVVHGGVVSLYLTAKESNLFTLQNPTALPNSL